MNDVFEGERNAQTPVDDNGHLIIDYSIHDAIAAGFDKIVFIIRHDIEADFRAVIGDRIEKLCKPLGVEIAYAYQKISDVPDFHGKEKLIRQKPCKCQILRLPLNLTPLL